MKPCPFCESRKLDYRMRNGEKAEVFAERAMRAWAGFVDDRIDVIEVDMGWGGFNTGDFVKVPAIFKTRREARKKYREVHRVEIRVVQS